jgi:hypothetical protein
MRTSVCESRSMTRFLGDLWHFRCNSTTLGKGSREISAACAGHFRGRSLRLPLPSVPLPGPFCWTSPTRGGAFVRGTSDEGSENRETRCCRTCTEDEISSRYLPRDWRHRISCSTEGEINEYIPAGLHSFSNGVYIHKLLLASHHKFL